MAGAPIRPLRSAWIINIKHKHGSQVQSILSYGRSRPAQSRNLTHGVPVISKPEYAMMMQINGILEASSSTPGHTHSPWSDDDSRHMDIRYVLHWNGEPAAALQHEVDVTPLDAISIDG